MSRYVWPTQRTAQGLRGRSIPRTSLRINRANAPNFYCSDRVLAKHSRSPHHRGRSHRHRTKRHLQLRRRRASPGRRLRTTGSSMLLCSCLPIRPVAPVISALMRFSFGLRHRMQASSKSMLLICLPELHWGATQVAGSLVRRGPAVRQLFLCQTSPIARRNAAGFADDDTGSNRRPLPV